MGTFVSKDKSKSYYGKVVTVTPSGKIAEASPSVSISGSETAGDIVRRSRSISSTYGADTLDVQRQIADASVKQAEAVKISGARGGGRSQDFFTPASLTNQSIDPSIAPRLQGVQPTQQLQTKPPPTSRIGAASQSLSIATREAQKKSDSRIRGMFKGGLESFKAGFQFSPDPRAEGSQTLSGTAGTVAGIASLTWAVPKGLKGIDILGNVVRGTKVAQFIERGGKAGRIAVAGLTYGTEAYVVQKGGKAIVDVLKPGGTGEKGTGLSELEFKKIFGEAREREISTGFKPTEKTKVTIGKTTYKIPGSGAVKGFFKGSAGALVTGLSPTKQEFTTTLEAKARAAGLSSEQIELVGMRGEQRRKGIGAVQTIGLLQAEAFANVVGAREVKLAGVSGKFRTVWEGFNAKVVPGALEGGIATGVILSSTESQLPTFIPRIKTTPGTPGTSKVVGTTTTLGTPQESISFKELPGGGYEKIVTTTTPTTTTQDILETLPTPESKKFVPSKAMLVAAGGGVGILSAGAFGAGEKYFEKSKVFSKVWGGFGFASDVPEYPGDVVTPILTASKVASGGRVRTVTAIPVTGAFTETGMGDTPKTRTKTKTTHGSVVSDVTSFVKSRGGKQTSTKVSIDIGTSGVTTPIKTKSRGGTSRSISLAPSLSESNILTKAKTSTDVTKISTDITNINKDLVPIDTKTRVSTDVMDQVFNRVSTDVTTNVNVMTSKIPFFVIPGGGGSGKGWNKIFGSGRVKSKYAPSLAASVYNIRAKKKPKIISGLGIRPVLI